MKLNLYLSLAKVLTGNVGEEFVVNGFELKNRLVHCTIKNRRSQEETLFLLHWDREKCQIGLMHGNTEWFPKSVEKALRANLPKECWFYYFLEKDDKIGVTLLSGLPVESFEVKNAQLRSESANSYAETIKLGMLEFIKLMRLLSGLRQHLSASS